MPIPESTPDQIFGQSFWGVLSGSIELAHAPDTIRTLGGIAYLAVQDGEVGQTTEEGRIICKYNPPWAQSVNFDMFGPFRGGEPRITHIDSLLLDHPKAELFVVMADYNTVRINDRNYALTAAGLQRTARLVIATAAQAFFDAAPPIG